MIMGLPVKFWHNFLKAILKTGETHSPPRGLGVFLYTNRSCFALTPTKQDYTCYVSFYLRKLSELRSNERGVICIGLLTLIAEHLLRLDVT